MTIRGGTAMQGRMLGAAILVVLQGGKGPCGILDMGFQ